MSVTLKLYRRESDKTTSTRERTRRALEVIEVYQTNATSVGAYIDCVKHVKRILSGE